jgi:hypothetical protein
LVLLVVAPPALVLAAAGALLGSPSGEVFGALALAAAAWLLEARALAPWVRHHRAPAAWAWSLPLAGALYAAMTATSAWLDATGRGVRWKDRSYAGGEVGEGSADPEAS